MAAVIEQADQRGGGEWTTKAYPVKWANPSTISAALTSVVPDAKISPRPDQQDADRHRLGQRPQRSRQCWTRRTSGVAAANW